MIVESGMILLPFAGAVACFLVSGRTRILAALTASLFTSAAAAATVLQVFTHEEMRIPLGGWPQPLGIQLHIDGLSVVFLLMSAVVGLMVSIYSSVFFARQTEERHFWPLWLLLWAGLNSLFMVSDIFNAYVVLELVTICAAALAVLSGKVESLKAGLRYFLIAMAGSLAFLLGVGFLYAETGMLDMFALGEEVTGSLPLAVSFGLMTAGLAMKTALLPFHFWLPPAHGEALAPVSAVLSALVIKASFYLLLRLWAGVFEPAISVYAAQTIGFLGMAAVLWGSYQAVIQSRLKLVIAYSSVGQIGYLFLLFPLVFAVQETTWAAQAWTGGVYHAVSHALAKAAMFMAAGNLIIATGNDRIDYMRNVVGSLPLTTMSLGLAGISLMGLPPSGGFVAKWMLMKAVFASGQWWWVIALVFGGLLTAAYVFRILGHAFESGDRRKPMRPVPLILETVPLILALGSILIGFRAEEVIFLLEERMLWEIPGGNSP